MQLTFPAFIAFQLLSLGSLAPVIDEPQSLVYDITRKEFTNADLTVTGQKNPSVNVHVHLRTKRNGYDAKLDLAHSPDAASLEEQPLQSPVRFGHFRTKRNENDFELNKAQPGVAVTGWMVPPFPPPQVDKHRIKRNENDFKWNLGQSSQSVHGQKKLPSSLLGVMYPRVKPTTDHDELNHDQTDSVARGPVKRPTISVNDAQYRVKRNENDFELNVAAAGLTITGQKGTPSPPVIGHVDVPSRPKRRALDADLYTSGPTQPKQPLLSSNRRYHLQ